MANPCKCMNCNVFTQSIFKDEKFDKVVGISNNCISFRKDEYLFNEDQASAGVFCLKSGRLLITKRNRTAKELTIAIAEPAEIVGLSAILYYQDKYSTSAMALEDGSACFISKEDFMREVRSHPHIAINAAWLLTQKLKKLGQEA